MKTRKIGIELIHHTKENIWYQYTSQCTFWDISTANKFDLTRLQITEAETEILFEQLDMKQYLKHEDIIYYGCPVVRKVKRTLPRYIEILKKLEAPKVPQ